MLFSCSAGSKGIENDETYSIFVPLILSNGNEINIEDGKYEGLLGDYRCILEKHHYQFSLKVEGLASREDGLEFIGQLKIAISWLIIKRTTGIKYPSQVSELHFFDSPIVISDECDYKSIADLAGWSAIDGDYNADQLVIFPEKERLIRLEMGKVGVKLGYSPSNVIADINECLNLETIDELFDNKKLKIAVDLFSAYKFENTSTGKFVKLVTVLEALLPEGEINSNSILALGKAKAAIKLYGKELKKSGVETNDIEHLLSKIGNLKYRSIGGNLEEYMREILEKNPNLGEPDVVIPKIRDIYNARSLLLHTGNYDEQLIQEYLSVLSDLVPRILKSYFGVVERMP